MEQPRIVAASLALLDLDDGGDGSLVAACLATKRSPHTREAYLRDMARSAGWLAGHGVSLVRASRSASRDYGKSLLK